MGLGTKIVNMQSVESINDRKQEQHTCGTVPCDDTENGDQGTRTGVPALDTARKKRLPVEACYAVDLVVIRGDRTQLRTGLGLCNREPAESTRIELRVARQRPGLGPCNGLVVHGSVREDVVRWRKIPPDADEAGTDVRVDQRRVRQAGGRPQVTKVYASAARKVGPDQRVEHVRRALAAGHTDEALGAVGHPTEPIWHIPTWVHGRLKKWDYD